VLAGDGDQDPFERFRIEPVEAADVEVCTVVPGLLHCLTDALHASPHQCCFPGSGAADHQQSTIWLQLDGSGDFVDDLFARVRLDVEAGFRIRLDERIHQGHVLSEPFESSHRASVAPSNRPGRP
jgi:hypothetical protein